MEELVGLTIDIKSTSIDRKPFPTADRELARLLALQAISINVLGSVGVRFPQLDRYRESVGYRFPASWTPQARYLWLAGVTTDDAFADPRYQAEVRSLEKAGFDVRGIRIAELVKARLRKPVIETARIFMDIAERDRGNVPALRRVATHMSLAVQLAGVKSTKFPKPTAEDRERALRLEYIYSRRLAEQLNDRVIPSEMFRIIREYRPPN